MTKFNELHQVVNAILMDAQTANNIFDFKSVVTQIDRLLEDLGNAWHRAMIMLTEEEKQAKHDKFQRVGKIMLRLEELRSECVGEILEIVKFEI